MAQIRNIYRIKPIAGLLSTQKSIFVELAVQMASEYSPIDHATEILPFPHSTYYENEMGQPLYRQFVSLRELMHPDELVSMKEWSNALEDEWAVDGKRIINIDPGYITLHNLVLASAKDFSHRIHLGRGIFGDVNLIYSGQGGYQALPWSYPDYVEQAAFFNEVRSTYKQQLDEWLHSHPEKKRD